MIIVLVVGSSFVRQRVLDTTFGYDLLLNVETKDVLHVFFLYDISGKGWHFAIRKAYKPYFTDVIVKSISELYSASL